VLNVLVPQVMLDRPGIVAIIGQLEAGGMAEHVGMDREPELCLHPDPCDNLAKRGVGQGALAFRHEHIWGVGVQARQLAEGPQFDPI
jgi:hypothetical protein